jgi:hypothetical protein
VIPVRVLALLGVLLLTLMAASCDRGSTPVVPAGQGHRLAFAEDGRLASPQTAVDSIVADAAKATDIFIFSHGWWNSPATAECRYARMIEGVSMLAQRQKPADFRVVLVGVYWPSAVFPVAKGDCDERPSGEAPEASAADLGPRITAWAASAFPAASARAGFAGDVQRVAELLAREQDGQRLTAAESTELTTLLFAWREAGRTGATVVDVGEGMFEGTAAEAARRWQGGGVKREGESGGEREAAGSGRWIDWANVFTFWTMKDRAGVVGSRGLYDVVRRLQELRARGLRIHLVGHSFGAKLVSASVTGHGRGPGNVVDSLVLLQGAFSHFAFSSIDEIERYEITTTRPGLYAGVLANGWVAGPIVVTYSVDDRANQAWYPLGVTMTNDFLERAAVGKFGSLGADGMQGPRAEALVLGRDTLAARIAATRARVYNIDGSAVIHGHSDLVKPEVFSLIWDAAMATRRP